MLNAMAEAAVHYLPQNGARHIPFVLGILSMPLSLLFEPDSIYFGVLPVVARAAGALGVAPISVGQAALLGHMTTGFPVSPLTPSPFLLVGLTGFSLAEHHANWFRITLNSRSHEMLLREIAHSRTGDKGRILTISPIAYRDEDYALLEKQVTAQMVGAYFGELIDRPVERYALAKISALNFVLHRPASRGVTRSLALDTHGKCLGYALLNLEI